jgi:CelD/BcsL family acetyltransferase involved in cellulose biosynthesis
LLRGIGHRAEEVAAVVGGTLRRGIMRAPTPELVEGWDRLAVATGAPPFMRPGWLRAWAEAFGQTAALRLVTVERGGELVAVLPVLAGPMGVRSTTNQETALYRPVTADPEATAELAERLLATRPRIIDVAAVTATDPDVVALRVAAERAGSAVHVQSMRRSPYVDVSGNPEQFRRGLSKNRRHGLTRLQNRMAEAGTVAFDVRDGRTDLPALLDEGLRLEAREWKVAAGSAVLSSPASVAFYTAATRWAADTDLLRLVFLRLSGKAIGFGLCLQYGATLSFLKLGMDDSYAKLGPGVVLTQHLIDYAFADPELRELDLLGDNESYKADLASGTREQVRMMLFPGRTGPALRGSVAAAAWARSEVAARLPESTRDRLSALRNRLRR